MKFAVAFATVHAVAAASEDGSNEVTKVHEMFIAGTCEYYEGDACAGTAFAADDWTNARPDWTLGDASAACMAITHHGSGPIAGLGSDGVSKWAAEITCSSTEATVSRIKTDPESHVCTPEGGEQTVEGVTTLTTEEHAKMAKRECAKLKFSVDGTVNDWSIRCRTYTGGALCDFQDTNNPLHSVSDDAATAGIAGSAILGAAALVFA